MDWTWGLPLLMVLLLCPLMMFGMMLFGRLFMRGGARGHSGHGGMMCHMGHGGEGHEHQGYRGSGAAASQDLLAELNAERNRLDDLIARAEREKSVTRGS